MIVYAAQDNLIIWSNNNKSHKAGRVPLGEPLTVIHEQAEFYEIKRPAHITLPADPQYPSYLVEKQYVTKGESQGSEEVPSAVSEEKAVEAFRVILRYITER